MKPTPALESRRLLRSRLHGMLSTLSRRFDGYPFGSVTPYVLDAQGRPVILISTLAEHTKNLDANPHASLLVQEPGEDVQALGRVTLIGDASRLTPQEAEQGIRQRYLRYFPGAAGYFGTHDFHFYRIEPLMLRYIGGFGRIHWISPEEYLPDEQRTSLAEPEILSHMNQDHLGNLRDYCRHFHGTIAAAVEMVGIDCDGFDVRADGKLLRFWFSKPVLDARMAREALVKMAQESKTEEAS